MNKRSRTSGYTIVEVMIFLVVSTALFVSATALISGQQGKTQFTQALNDIEAQIKDVANDVGNGFYPNPNNFTCTANGAGPIIVSSGSAAQGKNLGCIYIGRVMQFGVAGSNREAFNTYTIAGQRFSTAGSTTLSTSLAEAKPVAIAQASGAYASVPNDFEPDTLLNGLRVSKMYYVVGGTTTNIGAVGFFGSFSSYSSGNLVSGSQSIDLIPIPGTALDQSSQTSADNINVFTGVAYSVNPPNGVVICFESGGSSQYGQITIGSNGRQLSTKRVIGSGACP